MPYSSSFKIPMTLFEFQGSLSKSTKKIVTPKDHISVANVYFSCLRIWGLINWIVPENEVVSWSLLWLLMILATPKSANLIPSSWIKIFLGLISRWMMFLYFKNFKAIMICATNLLTISSESPSLCSSIKSSRVPLLQYSMNKKSDVGVFLASIYFKM